MNAIKIISYVLVLVGALNWGLVGLFNINLVALIFGDMTALARIVYTLVGLSAVIYLGMSYKNIFERY